MSALTKLFVILLIVCSMLFTAGVVVFINRTDDFARSNDVLKHEVRRLPGEREASENLARAAQLREVAAAAELNRKIAEQQMNIAQLQKDVAAAGTSTNADKTQIAVLTAQLTDASSAIKTINQSLKDLQGRNDALVKQNSELSIQNANLVAANTDLQKKNETADRELRFLNDQVAQLKTDLNKAQQAIRDAQGRRPG
jgi:chromosome segregation ATPase